MAIGGSTAQETQRARTGAADALNGWRHQTASWSLCAEGDQERGGVEILFTLLVLDRLSRTGGAESAVERRGSLESASDDWSGRRYQKLKAQDSEFHAGA